MRRMPVIIMLILLVGMQPGDGFLVNAAGAAEEGVAVREYSPGGDTQSIEEEEAAGAPDIVEDVETVELIVPSEPEGKKKSAEDTITLDFRGVKLVDVFQLLSERSGLSIIVGKNVRGEVFIFLEDVKIWDAFEFIVTSNDLAYERRGNLVSVMTKKEYESLYGAEYGGTKVSKVIPLRYGKSAEVAKALQSVKSKLGSAVADEGSNFLILADTSTKVKEMEDIIRVLDRRTETRVFALDYGKAEDIKEKIESEFTTGVGRMYIDERTGRIIVTDLPEKVNKIARVIEAFDAKDKEVLIVAKIIQVNLSDKYKMGIDWEAILRRFQDLNLKADFGLTPSPTSFGQIKIGVVPPTGSAETNYGALIQLLETVGDTSLLSSPRITVLNNQEAKIVVGTSQPYVTQTVSAPSSGPTVTAEEVTYIDVGVQLYVTPVINDKGFVTIKIRPVISSTETPLETAEGNEIPVVKISEAETTVSVKDGVTIVIGGLIETTDSDDVKRIPFLGNIPVLGNAFKSTEKELTKKETVIFLTPYIISGDSLPGKTASLEPVEIVEPLGPMLSEKEVEIGRETIDRFGSNAN